jgi:hypothetical protein
MTFRRYTQSPAFAKMAFVWRMSFRRTTTQSFRQKPAARGNLTGGGDGSYDDGSNDGGGGGGVAGEVVV